MEIFTLVKANIRRKKGAFIAVMLLTIIITASSCGIFSLLEGYEKDSQEAYSYIGDPAITGFISQSKMTAELKKSVEDCKEVGKINVYDGVLNTDSISVDYDDSENSVNNTTFFTPMRDEIRLFNSDLTAYEDNVPKLQKDEMYLPLGFKDLLKCNVGDTLKTVFSEKEYEFKLKGFVCEPVLGSSTIGIKQAFINADTLKEIKDFTQKKFEKDYAGAENADAFNPNENVYQIYKADNCTLSDKDFKREVNSETKIIDKSLLSLTAADSKRYTGLLEDLLCKIVLVFVVMLFVIALIVIGHSISNEIELDYVNLGILKSQGFEKGQIRKIIAVQYLLAEIIGAVIGAALSFPVVSTLSRMFMMVSAILPNPKISALASGLVLLAILGFSLILMAIKTAGVAKISPMKAISGGQTENNFDGKTALPISKKSLSLSLAVRQFTCAKRRYVSTMLIVTILTFFMITVNLVGSMLSSRKACEIMGFAITDLDISLNEDFYKKNDKSFEDTHKEILEIAEKHSKISKDFSRIGKYLSLNGYELSCTIYYRPENITGMIRGEAPKDDEVIITEMVGDEYDLDIGDKVTVSGPDGEAKYKISGIYQSMNDTGNTFAMSYNGAKKICKDTKLYYIGFALEEPEKNKAIADEINEKLSDYVEATAWDMEDLDSTEYDQEVNALKAVIYVFSVIFIIVTVALVCSKAFVRERRDIGIYKAVGFGTGRLRLQFALRFAAVSAIGAVLGTLLSLAFSEKLTAVMLRAIGFSYVSFEFNIAGILVPFAVIVVSFFVFSFIASRKIKKVEIKELVVE